MKNIYSSKRLLKFGFSMILLSSVLGVVSSCKKDDEPDFTSHNVQFKVEATNDVHIKAIVTQVGTVQTSNYVVTGTSWNSENINVNSTQGSVNIASTADGFDADSKLIVKILVDGELKKTDTAKGLDLKAMTTYSFYKQF
ncbi:hypothetical protein [Chryseobacterium sp.]|uniref:hypothetical protein n=1 Tax=Chryseobacterium sp. TaxID=1871047 RepID=UPI0011C888EE|nr:hypothetical protein [Chryseobacterium sp.]TXF79367.1 hypothetical protein FUA25_02985 [Chryseobacterium sp.]